jgi:hypothetical protein
MGTTRESPDSIIGRQKAMTKAQTKKNGATVPADNILSAATSARLDLDLAAYNAGILAITTAKQAYHNCIELAVPQRVFLKDNITSYFKTFNNCIDKLGTIPASARAFYLLPIGKASLPKMDTDDELLAAAAIVLSGDILRIKDGGIVMSVPTIAEFTIVYDIAKPVIVAISNALTAVTNATSSLKKQIPEIKDLITHIWNEVEAYYSLYAPSERRVFCRLWGVRYISTGVPSVVTGACKDALGIALAGAKIRIMGSSHSTLTDALGNFSLNTSLYGDLELLATLKKYEKTTIDFSKDDGIAEVVDVVMTHV